MPIDEFAERPLAFGDVRAKDGLRFRMIDEERRIRQVRSVRCALERPAQFSSPQVLDGRAVENSLSVLNYESEVDILGVAICEIHVSGVRENHVRALTKELA